MQQEVPSSERDLFGGAIKAKLPTTLIDASDLRQIPDTQEVFLYPQSGISVIVEILERVEATDNTDAVRFHFDSLAHDNSAESSQSDSIVIIPNDRGDNTPSAIVLTGSQKVPKFNQSAADDVRILMSLFRVETKNADLVVTFNVPVSSQDGGAVGEEGWRAAKSDFENMIRSFRIVDYGLFA
ncbi:hypothetical protein PC9H_001093 [Pleurotus ostreatus]|uniref:Ran guanine nucleotide release factor n=1 Tax=Pleurotus ostreatus TaxID=5322 RepID=A0A8H7A9R8_PLEOS|nr:uncharacterized protein PC9H_001093 [Pleurotus ostreatus]KAF7440745.1 hypothetical protein PC9H_001093 [Pleurotus ostreatus]KAJ8699856.1 hypothetical protein PTI98_002935 [Pleurotus ostreatus]